MMDPVQGQPQLKSASQILEEDQKGRRVPGATPEWGVMSAADALAIETEEELSNLAQTLNVTVGEKPDKAAQDSSLAQRSGLPYPVVKRNSDAVSRQERIRQLQEALRGSPALKEWMKDPRKAEMSHADAERLAELEHKTRTMDEIARDILVTGYKGFAGVTQAVFGLADLVTGGRFGKAQAEDLGIDPTAAMEWADQFYSLETKRAQQKVSEAQGFMRTIKAALENPSTIAIGIGESLPSMIAGGQIGKGVARYFPNLSSALIGGIGEGSIQTGQSAEQARAGSESGLLTVQQALAAVASGGIDAAISTLGGMVAKRLGLEDADVLVTGRTLSPGSRKMIGTKFLEGMLQEGLLEELPQSMQEQMWQNWAENKPILEGVSQAGVLGMFAGMAMGGGANLISGVANRGSRANAALLDAATSIESTRLMQNSPETLAEYAQRVGDTNGVSKVYLQADRAVEVALKNGMTAEQIPGWLAGYGVTEVQLQTELQSGGKLELNLGPVIPGLTTDPVIQALKGELLIRPGDVSKSGLKGAQENEAEHLAHLDELYQTEQANKITTDDIDAWKKAILDTPDLKGKVTPEHLMPLVARANVLSTLTGTPAIDHLNRMLTPAGIQVTKYAEFAKAHTGAVMQKVEGPNIDSPEFKAWFGESKVVDENGKPLVVSHVSPGRFKKFDSNLGWHYFTDSQSYLDQVKKARGLIEDKPLVQRDFYLALKNPLDLRSLGNKTTVGEFNSFLAANGIDLATIYGPYATEVVKPGGTVKTTAIIIAEQREIRDAEFTQAFKDAGYDGAIIPDYLDSSMDRGITEKVAATSYAVFDPAQIKSVNNQGTFSPTDPNIYHQESVVDKFIQNVENQAKILYQVHTVNAWEKNVEQWMDDNEVPTKRRKEIHENLLAAKALANSLEEVKDLFPHNPMWETRNEKGKLPTPVRDNSDKVLYIKSLDLSASCVKRLEYGANLIELYRVLGRAPTADDAMLMVVRMREEGKEAPCVYCYVESPRRAFAEEASRYAGILSGEIKLTKPIKPEEQEKYKRDKAMVKQAQAAGFKMADFDVTPFLTDQAQSAHAEQFKEFYAWIRGKAQASSNQNAVKTYVDYSGQLLELAGKANSKTDQIPFKDWINQRAGMRIFSTSDFQIEHVYDLLQAVVDMNAVGMKAHAYTKQSSFVRIFGATGIKIQMSVFATERNGEFIPDTAMGMDWAEAQALREKYGNAGTVMVTTSDAMTKWALEQDWIDYIIPFHASGMPKAFFRDALNWQNFTSTQNEKSLTGDPTRKTIMQEFAGTKGKTLPQLTKAYLALCEERGIQPVFPQYQFLENGKVNPNFAKLRKDYARTDTPFVVPDPRKIDMDVMKELLDEYIANGGRNVQADTKFVKKIAAEIKSGVKGREALAESDWATRGFLTQSARPPQESSVAEEPVAQRSIIASEGGVTYVSEADRSDADAGSGSAAGNMDTTVYTPYEVENPLSKAYVKKFLTGKMLSAISTIKSPADAAHVAFPLTSKAQEHLIAIVTTKAGKILGVVQHTTGTINQSLAQARDLLGVVHDFPGAAKVWLAHNHPSGDPTTSSQDADVSDRVRKVLKGSGMSYQGMLAVGASGGAVWINPETAVSESISLADLRATDQRAKKISTYDREIVSLPETSPVRDSESALKAIQSLKGEASGVMILNTKNYPVAFVPMTQTEMIHLKTGDVATGSSAIMQAFHRSNGAVMIVTAPDLRFDVVQNLVSFGHMLGAQVLDGIDSRSGSSFQEKRSLPRARETFYQKPKNQDPYAALSFTSSGENIISLFEKANKSSFLHETGHIFLNDLKYVAENLGVQTEEWNKVKSWLGVGADGVITTPMHEKFADHFEAYLKTGQAPTTELRSAFRKFKKWLTQIYDIARGKNGRDLSDIQINPEIKDLFDRLLATEQEIKAEREQAALIAMLDDKLLNESNFTPEQIAEYKQIVAQAEDSAIENRDKRKLVGRDERLKEWKKQATDEAAKRPVYAFQEKMREKVSRASIVDQFGEENIPENSPMYGYEGSGARDINIAIAEGGKEFGYDSAGAFIGDLRSAPPKAQWIQKRIAQLETQYDNQQDTQDAIRTSSLKRQLELESQFLAKQAAKENEAQAKKQKDYEQRWKDAEAKLEEAIREGQQEAELQKLRDQIAALKAEKAAGAKAFREAKPIPAFALDIWARNIVRGRTLSEIQNIGKLLVESKKHRQEAIKATRKGQWDEALKANEKARMTEELIRASYQAQRQWRSVEARWKKIAKWTNDNKSVKIGARFRDQINRILSDYGIAQREYDEAAQDLHSFVESLAENELESAATSLADWIGVQTGAYTKKSWEQIQDLDDALKFLYGKGREEVEGLRTSWGKKITEIADDILGAQVDVRNLPNLASDATRIGRVVQGIQKNYRKFFAQTGILRFIARRIDGYTNIGGSGTMGPAEKIVQRVINGMAQSNDKWAAISARIEPLLQVLTQNGSQVFGDIRLPQKFQQYGMSWTKERVVVAALNMGNDSNLQRLRDGYGLTDSDILALQGKLTAEEWGAIQKIWKELASLWPEIANVHERMNFFRPKQLDIQPLTVRTADGQTLDLSGGYYPVSYDKSMDREIARWTEKDDLIASHRAVLQKPVAKSGFTKARAEETTRPIDLSLAKLGTHFNDTIRYITLAEAIKDADRVFNNGRLADRNIQTIGRDLQDMITPALKNVLRPERRDLGLFEKGRVGMSMFYMGYNAWTALQNITGVFPMIRQAGAANYLNGMFHLMKSGPWNAHRAMMEASGYMRLRETNIERDMKSQLRNFGVGGIEINGKRYTFDDVKSLGFAGIRMVDAAVSLPAWWGRYNAEMEAHGDIQKATEAADSAVNAALGSGLAIDVNAIGRHPFLSLLAPFMSFAATQQEVLATEKAAWRSGKISASEYLYGVLMTVVFPALASTFLQGVLMYGLAGAVGGGDDESREKNTRDYITDLLSYRLMGIPFFRDLFNAIVQGVEHKAPITGARMPVTEGLKMLQQFAYRVGNWDGSEKSTKATMWSAAEIASLWSGIPASRIYDRWMKGTQDIENGEGWFGNHFIPQERKK